MRLTGIYVPLVTPFKDERVMLRDFQDNIERCNGSELSGYVLFGSSGEAAHLSYDEKVSLMEAAVAARGKEKLLIAGTGLESTSKTIELTLKMAELGADAALVLTPHYYKKEDNFEEMRAHYVSVADASPIPIVLYNVPGFTALDLPQKTICELACHPNIIGIKDSSRDIHKIAQVVEETPDDFSVLIGNALLLVQALEKGAVGAILALCAVAYQEVIEVYNLSQERCFSQAREIHLQLQPVVHQILNKYGVPGIKAALNLMGFQGGEPRKPFLIPDRRSVNEIKQCLKTARMLS